MIVPASPALPLTPAPAPAGPELRAELQRLFGFPAFRPGQEEVIRAVLGGRDTLALMPTGAGKSLCYQLPAMLLPGVTLVISPLIALMKDQHDNLPEGIFEQSTFINSSLDGVEVERRMAEVLAGRIKLVYAAPERLRQQSFVHALRRAGVSLLVIDEVHCVSLWGHDFRPDYLFIGRCLAGLGEPRVLGMTATATPRVAQEIGAQLGRALYLVHTSPFRGNLFYQVRFCTQAKEKTRALVEFCRDQGKTAGIVYVRSRRQAEELAWDLRNAGVQAAHYHAGLESAERSATQERWMLDKTRVIVATIAFGMGIDKSNVRYIVHYSPPDSLESYAQESGRAGRDGRPAFCLMLATPGDRANLARWLRESLLDVEQLRRIYRALTRQVPGTGRATLVHLGDLERDTNEGQPAPLDETGLRVGIGLLERAGLVVRYADAPGGATVRLAPTALPDPAFTAFCAAAGLAPGSSGEISLPGMAGRLGCSPVDVEARLLDWQDAGWLRFRAGGREAVIERVKAPADAGRRMEELLGQYAAAQQARLSELMGYAGTQECRHVVIARHLGHTIVPCGSGCDNCRTGAGQHAHQPTAAAQSAQLEALLARARTAKAAFAGTHLTSKSAATILGAVAELPHPVNKTALAQVLVGYETAPFHKDQAPSFGALGGQQRQGVARQIDALVELGYLRADNSMGARVIVLGDIQDVAPEPARARRPAPAGDDGTEAGPVYQAWRRYEQDGAEPPDFDPTGPESPFRRPGPAPVVREEAEPPPLPDNPAQIMLECIASLPFPLGKTKTAQVLAGASSAIIDADRCRHFGALAMCTQDALVAGLQTLLDAGWLRQMGTEKPVLARTARSQQETPPPDLVQLAYKPGLDPATRRRRLEREQDRQVAAQAAARLASAQLRDPVDDEGAADRFERLRVWRRLAAGKANIPPYMIFHDKTLWAFAHAHLATLDDLRAIPGVGRLNTEKYGAEILAILAEEPSDA